ncbi:hypothetical protein EG68_00411 [Paragonimus skrjabini miyazakii]|uniref:Ig-like domain-containing protein n=1 Tax=Paragonimus skrjabini miyazakii TaxID=59628 RepID=A0A8S9ZCN8_9TREM|nr:hypothetical protein EG68_00411 [Paragonimus skrjabini miyazakii]
MIATPHMHEYVDYTNDDFTSMHITYSTMSSENELWITYVVKSPFVVTWMNVLDVRTGEQLFYCELEDGRQSSSCCLHGYPDEETLNLCTNFSLFLTNSDEQENVMKFYTGLIQDPSWLLIWFGIRNGQTRLRYFSQHDHRDGSVVCPQFARDTPYTVPIELGNELRQRATMYSISQADLTTPVIWEEYGSFELNVVGFASMDHVFQVLCIRYYPHLEIFTSLKVDLMQSNRRFAQQGFENRFILGIQWHPEYRHYIHVWNLTLSIPRYTVAMLFTIHLKSIDIEKIALKQLEFWIKNKNGSNNLFTWPEGQQYPASRLIGLNLTRDVIFVEGQDKILHIDENEVDGTNTRYCYKRQTKMEEYELTQRMVSLPGQPFFKLANLTIKDSGMYMCKNRSQTGSDYAIVMDYYIIVLPRNEDVSVIFSTLPILETDKLEDSYPYIDVLNRSYIYELKKIYVTCMYSLSNGLDNHDGFQPIFFSGSSKQNHSLFRKFRRDLGEFSVYVFTYQINLVTNIKTESTFFFECSYVYNPVFHLLRNSRPVPPKLARTAQRRRIIQVSYSRPLIIASSIDTSSTSITEQLKRSSLVLEDLHISTSIKVNRVNIMEGVISGTFVGLLHEFRGWGSVVTYSKNTNQTTFSIVNCSTDSQKITVHKNDSLWRSEEMGKSHTLIAKHFHFQCTLSLETIQLVFSVFNSWQEVANRSLVAWLAHQRLYTMTGGDQTYVDLSVDHPLAAVYGAFKFAVIQVGWIGTVYPGNPIKMLWPVDDQEIRELRCVYSMSADSPPTKVNLGFLAQKLATVSMYQLAKRNASEEDSGLYYCTTCLNCSSVALSDTRRLVVLPDASRLQMSVLHGNATHHGSGSPDDPIRTEAEPVFIRCSCMVYAGLLTKFDLVVAYETGIPKSTEHLPLRASQKLKRSGSQDAYHRLSITYELEKPTENVYWNYTRVNCSMRLFNLTKDSHDLTKNVTSHVITKSLYFSYDIARQPVLFPLFIKTTSDELTSGLRRDQAADINKAFSSEQAPAVRELAGIYEIEYTMFMGLPAGWTQVWVVYKSENDEGILNCPHESSVPIKSSEDVPGLASTQIYTSNGGLNFVRHKFACLLDIDRFVLIVVAFGNVKHEENLNTMEKLLKQRFSNWIMSRRKNMSLVTINTKVAANDMSISYRITRLNIIWRASVNIGQPVFMLGERPIDSSAEVSCFYKANEADEFGTVPTEFAYNKSQPTRWFRATIAEAKYWNSGIYKCNLTNDRSKSLPQIILAPRELVVLPDSSILILHLNHKPVIPNTISKANFTQYLPSGTPFLKAEQHASVRCIYLESPIQRLETKLHIVYEMYDTKRAKYVSLAVFDPVNFTIRTGKLVFITGSRMIKAPDVMSYKGILRVTCQLIYRPGVIPHDQAPPIQTKLITQEKHVQLNVNANPFIFPSYIHSEKSGLLDNLLKITVNEMSAITFHQSGPRQRLEEDIVTFRLYIIRNSNARELIPATRTEPLSRPGEYALHSYMISLQLDDEYGSELQAVCEWEYKFPARLPNDVRQETDPIILNRSRIILVQVLIPPQIHNQYTVSNNLIVQGVIKRAYGKEQNAVLFHSKSRTILVAEQQVHLHLLFTLGVPRGRMFVWTVYEYANRLYKEPCWLTQLVNLTQQVIPAELQGPGARMYREMNVVNASFVCSFRVEQLALFMYVYTVQEESNKHPEVPSLLTGALLATIKHWIDNPRMSIMTRNQTNASEQLKATFVRQKYETRDTHELITQAYHIQAPATHEVTGPLRINCTVSYPNSSMEWSRGRTVEIVTQIRPFIFEDYVSTSRELLTDAFKYHLKSVPTSAVAFFNSAKPFNMHLEGKVRINFTVGLGKPNGWAGIDLLYMDKGLIRRKRCPQMLLKSFDDGSAIPKSIKESTYYKDSGSYGLAKYTVNCTLTLNVVAVLILAMNGFNPRLSSAARQNIFYSSVFDTLQYWFAQPNLSVSTKSIIIPSGSYVSYGLFALSIGWRASVFVGDPIIMVGLMLPGLTGHLHCYYYGQSEKTINRRELHIDKYSIFINTDPNKQLFELIKPVASMTDSGMYDCVLSSCPTCIALKLLVPHYLTVTPRHIDGSVHYSLKPVRSHSENHTVWNFDQTINANGTKFIYATQLVRVICDYHLPIGTTTKYNIQFLYSKLSRRNQSIQHLFFEEEFTGRVKAMSYLAVYSVYRIIGPTDSFLTDILETKCRLQLSQNTHTQADVNRVSEDACLNLAHTLLIRTWITPFIYSDTIQTDNKVITHAFRSAPKKRLNGAQFLRDYKRYKIVEGPLKITYVRSPGVPNGWSGVFSVYNRSRGFVVHACVLDHEHYVRRNKLDSSQHLRPEVSEENQYICLLLPKQIALLIYTAHYPQNGRNRSHFEKYFLPHVASVIETWFHEQTSTGKSIKFEIDAGGDYRLIPVQVRWTGTMKLGDPLKMYGLLSHNTSHTIDCFHGLTSAVEPLQGFTLERNHTMGYFLLRKPHVKMADTGVYACMAPRGAKYNQPVGFEQRELTVLPDSSILELLVERVQSSRSSELQCQIETLGILASEDRLLITCSNILYHSRFTAFQHIIVHGFVNDDETHSRLSRLATKIVKNRDGTEMFQSRVTLQLPRMYEQYSEWFVRCELSHQVPEDAPEGRSVNKVVGGELTTEQSYYVLNLRDPFIKDYRIQYWVSDSVDDTDLKFVDVDSYEHMEEGEYQITFTALLGFPQGWTFIRTFYVQDNQRIQPDRCGDLSQIYQNRADELLKQHLSSCILQPEHIAILMVVVTSIDMSLGVDTVEYQLENLFLQNLTVELYPNSPSTTDKPVGAAHCFRFDHRLIRLRIGWRATVRTGETIQMQGTLAWREMESLLCLVRNRRTGAEKPLPDSFSFIQQPGSEQFFLIKQHASPYDTGIYLCRAESETDREIYVGMQPRTLIVLPTQSDVGCELTLDQAGLNHVNMKQRLPDGTIYLLSRQVGFVHCRFTRALGQIYTVTYHLVYQMQNDMHNTEDIMRTLESGTHLSEQVDTETIRRVYQITSPKAEDYTGLLQVGCLSRFENLTTDHDILDWTGSFEVSCNIWFTIQEAANGNLTITSLSRKFAEQPVPLGSEFSCSGGQGMPRLTYSWVRIKSELYSPHTNDQTDLAMILPADGGGWGGPTQPFVDMPLKDLEVVGPLLRVPEDFSYRGMSYMYMCVGTNNILGVEHSIKKTIHLSILICPTDRESMDLTIFLSPRLMSACRFTHNPHPDMQYFGYYFVTLIRQLVLALPYGSNRTRFTFIQREKSNLSTFFWTRFDHRLDKKIILKRLYSRTAKPTSGQATCKSRLTSLTGTLRSVNQVYAAGFVNNPVLLLTVDNFLLVDYGPELVEEVNKLRQIGVKIILALTYPQRGTFREFSDNLIRILNPFATLNILPYFEGTHNCDSCQFGLEERRPRIRRAELFDQLCRASGSQLPAPIESPKLTYSLPEKHRFPGLHLLVTCTEAMVDWANPQMITQLDICLSNQTELSKLNRNVSTVQQLSKTCHRHLSTQQYLPTLKTSVRERKGFTNMIIIREIAAEPFVLCFQRLGEKDPSLFDAVNFTLGSVYGHEFPLGKPSLYVEHWPKFETQAALFRCAFKGFQTNLEVLLLVYSGNYSNSDKFFILARCLPNFIGDDNVTNCNMVWLELSTKQRLNKEFRCLFRPIESSTIGERFLTQLPTTSESVQYSDSLNIPQTYSDCPKAPELQVSQRDADSTLGSRLEFQCRTSGTSRKEPIKLFFLAPSFYFILCFRTRTVVNVHQNSCLFTSLDDEDCTNEVQKDPIYATLYQIDCITEAGRLGTPDLHTIYFSIPNLRLEDFGSNVFCQTVSLYTLGTTEDFFMQTMMTSDIHVIRFQLEPQITAFYYDRTRQIWKCSAAAFPLIHLGQIRVIHAQPMWLGKQLSTYVSSAHHVKRPPQQFETILPGVPYGMLEFMEEISFHSVLSRTGGLTHGIVELQCSFGQASRRLITKIGSQGTKYEPILPASPIRHYGQVITMVCTLNSPEANPVQTVMLHKWMRTYWLTYDLTVLIIVLYSKGGVDNLFGLHSWQTGFKPFGLWSLNKQPQIRVLSDQTHGVLSLGISILVGTVSEII